MNNILLFVLIGDEMKSPLEYCNEFHDDKYDGMPYDIYIYTIKII